MSQLQATSFDEFFKDMHGYEPFPWQRRLAHRVCGGDWPRCIALPTAAGKTACIDIAVFALACQEDRPPTARTAPRRVFFVVDRRIVVDQAREHAKKLAKLLAKPTTDVLRRVADALCRLAASDRPLDVYALRGGMYRESTWVRSPLQPTIITSTVDQVGSRLLFRGYGVSDASKPLHAALVGNDALILLDEAHCANPFDQTASAVTRYRHWTQEVAAPFRFVSMTATPSREVPEGEIERDREEDHADPRLGPRIRASKPARLVVADRAVGRNWRSALVKELVKHARARMESGCRAVGVIVNRVATARETAAALQGNDVEVVLLTGRMRPMDRDDTLKKIEPLLSGGPGDLPKPTFVVATQCLEVGADLDFHALVTECASLDALRQRFGRLNRVAARSGAKAVIVVRGDQIEPTDDLSKQDPVYGNSLANTWKWMNENKDGVDDETGPWIDFSVASIRAKWDTLTADRQAQLNAPVNDAAVLLPAHLDMWCQSNPIPLPDPDPAVFLHGPSRSTPDVQVVFRADLGNDQTEWPEIASLCPPSSAESLPVRIDVFKRWISREDTVDESSDVEGESILDREEPEPTGRRAVLRWQGPDSSETGVIASPAEVRPGGLYVVPIAVDSNLCLLGDFPNSLPTDQGDVAFQRARDRAILRLTPTVLHIPSLAGVTVDDDAFEAKLSDALRALASDPRDWVQRAAENLSRRSKRVVKPHPLGGFVLVGKKRLGQFDPTFVEADESSESVSDRPVVLTDHCRRVADFARRFADRCGLKAKQVDAVEWAGLLHDIGKADPRFQALLHGGNRRKADVFPYLLAKSIGPVPSNRERQLARERAGYPPDARHELLAVRLAESNSVLPPDPDDRDMVLHLIASHHGWCRPFAPVVRDANPTNVIFKDAERTLQASSATGLERLDSGVAERFWKLTRRFGWWGLPWLEAMVRLADWAASEAVAKEDHP